MPLSLEEYKRGSRYAVPRASLNATDGNHGIELLKSEPFEDPATGRKGIYTHKHYHIDGWVPAWIAKFLPASAMILNEESWDCFPHTKTVVTSPFLGEKFFLIIESLHAEDRGEQKNALKLDDKTLKDRSVSFIDIAHDEVDDKTQYKQEEDPKLFASKSTGRGPLKAKDWSKTSTPVMCCYKLVKARCKLWGLQSKLENYLMNMEKDIFLGFHKRIFCWIDDWYPLSIEQIMESEEKFWKELADKIQHVKQAHEQQPKPTESQNTEPQTTEPQVQNDTPPHDARDD